MVSDTVSSENSRKGRSCKDEKSNESIETTKKSDGSPLKGSGEDLPSKKRKFENDFTQVGVVGQRRTRRSEGDSDAEKRSESTRSTNKLLLKRDVSQEIVSPP